MNALVGPLVVPYPTACRGGDVTGLCGWLAPGPHIAGPPAGLCPQPPMSNEKPSRGLCFAGLGDPGLTHGSDSVHRVSGGFCSRGFPLVPEWLPHRPSVCLGLRMSGGWLTRVGGGGQWGGGGRWGVSGGSGKSRLGCARILKSKKKLEMTANASNIIGGCSFYHTSTLWAW